MKGSRESSPGSAGAMGLDVNLRLLYRALRERLWIVVLCAALALAGALLYLARAPRVYQAHAVVQVQAAEKNLMNMPDVNSRGELDKLESLKTIEFNLGRRDLMRRLLKSLNLQPADLNLAPGRAWSEDDMTDVLVQLISVNLLRGTRLIVVDASHTDPAMAAQLANALVAEYSRALVEQRSAVSTEANDFLVQEAARLKKKLEASEQALQHYKEQSKAVSLEESQNIIVDQLKELNAKLTEAKADRLKLDSACEQLRGQDAGSLEKLLSVAAIANAPQVVEQQRQVATQQAEVARLEERYLELHPKLIQAKGQLVQIRANLRNAAMEAANSLVALSQASRQTEAKYAEALAEQEQKALELNRLAIPYNALAREVASDSALFDAVLKRLKETDVTKSIDPGIIQVVQSAVVPRIPVKPRKKLVLAGSLAGGVVLGAVIALALWALDSSFRTVDQVERELGVPVLTTLPQVQRASVRSGGKSRRAMAEAFREPQVAESCRTLRTTLALQASPQKVLLITSSIPGEGKSFAAVNQAISLATGGSRTLLIDADLRLPVIEQVFFDARASGAPRKRGLSDVLEGACPLGDAVAGTDFEHLSVLTGGAMRDDPGKLFLTPAFGELLQAAQGSYDYIIIDSAPIHAVSDTLAIARHSMSVCMVVMAGKAPRHAVARALQLLVESGAKIAGVILNAVPERGEYFYHYRTSLADAPPAAAEPGFVPPAEPAERPAAT